MPAAVSQAASRPAALRTLRGIEHVSMTVPDLDEATAFFADLFGCQTMYTMGPFSAVTGGAKGSFMRTYANADVRAVVQNVRVLRSPYLNVELFQATYPGQRPVWPGVFDIGGWQLCAYVDDLDPAVSYARAHGLIVAEDSGTSCRLMTRFGLHLELVSRPSGPRPAVFGGPPTVAPRGGMPGFRGFEQICLTVPDLDEATAVFVELLAAEPAGELEIAGDVPMRVRVLHGEQLDYRLVQCPDHPGQNPVWPGMLDVGGWHLAFYVDDVDAALAQLAGLDLRVLGGKKPAYRFEAGEEAYTVHCLTEFGFYFELVTYPSGRYLAAEHAVPAWHPSA